MPQSGRRSPPASSSSARAAAARRPPRRRGSTRSPIRGRPRGCGSPSRSPMRARQACASSTAPSSRRASCAAASATVRSAGSLTPTSISAAPVSWAVTVTVRLFAGLRERAGWSSRELEGVARVGDVWAALGLGDEPPGLLYAVNKEYAEREPRARRRRRGRADPARLRRRLPAHRGAARPRRRESRGRDDEAGGIATFIGTTRVDSRGRTVRHLDYEAYGGMAEKVMAEIAERAEAAARALRRRDPPPRRPRRDRRAEVVIAVSAAHRAAALAACKEAIDTLKETRAALEEGGLRGRRGVDRKGVVRPERPPQPLQLDEMSDQETGRPLKELSPEAQRAFLERAGEPHRDYEPIQPVAARTGAAIGRRIWAPFSPSARSCSSSARSSSSSTSSWSALDARLVGGYALLWGWKFGVGFVAADLRPRDGPRARGAPPGPPAAPLFIPFLGALSR